MQLIWSGTCMSSQLDPGILLLEGHDKRRPVDHVLNLLPRLVLQKQTCGHPSVHPFIHPSIDAVTFNEENCSFEYNNLFFVSI